MLLRPNRYLFLQALINRLPYLENKHNIHGLCAASRVSDNAIGG